MLILYSIFCQIDIAIEHHYHFKHETLTLTFTLIALICFANCIMQLNKFNTEYPHNIDNRCKLYLFFMFTYFVCTSLLFGYYIDALQYEPSEYIPYRITSIILLCLFVCYIGYVSQLLFCAVKFGIIDRISAEDFQILYEDRV